MPWASPEYFRTTETRRMTRSPSDQVHGIGPVPIQIVGWFLIFVAAAVIVARIHLRLNIQQRRVMTSDVLMVAAWVCGCATTVVAAVMIKLRALDKEVGTSFERFPGNPADIPTILKIYWFGLIPFHLTLYLCRATLLSMYLQIFPQYMQKRRMLIWATIVYIILAFGASMGVIYRMCYPVEILWTARYNGTCGMIKGKIIYHICWALSTAGDILVFILPWLIIPELNVRKSLKIGLYLTFLLGLITIACAIMRFEVVHKSEKRRGSDVPFSTVIFWNTIECNLGIVIACLPSLRPYFGSNEKRPMLSQPSIVMRTDLNGEETETRRLAASISGATEEDSVCDSRKRSDNTHAELEGG